MYEESRVIPQLGFCYIHTCVRKQPEPYLPTQTQMPQGIYGTCHRRWKIFQYVHDIQCNIHGLRTKRVWCIQSLLYARRIQRRKIHVQQMPQIHHRKSKAPPALLQSTLQQTRYHPRLHSHHQRVHQKKQPRILRSRMDRSRRLRTTNTAVKCVLELLLSSCSYQ